MPETTEVKVSLADVEPVRNLLVAGIRLYDALYNMPGAAKFLTETAPQSVIKAYGDMQRLVRTDAPLLRLAAEEEKST